MSDAYIIPVVRGQHRTDGYPGVEFYCDWCRRLHRHGGGFGHRLAHCTDPASPYRPHGVLIVDGAADVSTDPFGVPTGPGGAA